MRILLAMVLLVAMAGCAVEGNTDVGKSAAKFGLLAYTLSATGAEGTASMNVGGKPGFEFHQGGRIEADGQFQASVNIDAARAKPMDPAVLKALCEVAGVPTSQPAVE